MKQTIHENLRVFPFIGSHEIAIFLDVAKLRSNATHFHWFFYAVKRVAAVTLVIPWKGIHVMYFVKHIMRLSKFKLDVFVAKPLRQRIEWWLQKYRPGKGLYSLSCPFNSKPNKYYWKLKRTHWKQALQYIVQVIHCIIRINTADVFQEFRYKYRRVGISQIQQYWTPTANHYFIGGQKALIG